MERGTALYVYGVVRSGRGFRSTDGVLGGTVATVEHRRLAALTGLVPERSVRAKRRDLLRHSEVLQQAFADQGVLPFRFGIVFPDAQALVDEVLEPRQEELLDLLDRFADAGELRLRAAYHDRDSILADIVRGDSALARLRDQSRGRSGADPKVLQLGEAVAHAFAARRRTDADAIVSRLAKLAEEVVVDEPTGELEVLRASFLVRRRKTRKFDELLESVALAHRHLITFTCTGPVPPHSFVDLDGA